MAALYKRPLAVFLLSKPAKDFAALKDFRISSRNENKPYSRDLILAFRRVYMQREVILELAESTGEPVQPIDLSLDLDDDPDQAGERIRAWLGTPSRENDRGDDLNRWIELVEVKTILVAQVRNVDPNEMRGCSISDQPFPIIVLNVKDSRRGRVFTLMHELSHILLHSGGVCDLDERRSRVHTDREKIERFCNDVAAATLMPRSAVLRDLTDLTVARYAPATSWKDEEVRRLADKYGVSHEAMLVRLK